jgi:hypothetical protein
MTAVYGPTSPEQIPGVTQQQLRDSYLVEDLSVPGIVRTVAAGTDRGGPRRPRRTAGAPAAGYRDGVQAITVGIAGNLSLDSELPVRIADLDPATVLRRSEVLA